MNSFIEIPWIVVDTSYLNYYSISSAWNWYKRQYAPTLQKGVPFDIEVDGDEYYSMLKYCFESNVLKPLNSRLDIFDKNKIIFCLDCSRKNIWRRSYYPLYKYDRDIKKDKEVHEFTTDKAFSRLRRVILPAIVEKWGCHILEDECCEGDDLIALSTKKLTGDSKNVVIVTHDYDMAQLLSDNVSIYTVGGECIDLSKIKSKYGVESVSEFVKMKIFLGDMGDNVPAIHDRCGKSTALRYIKNPEYLINNKKTPAAVIKENLERNRLMVDLNRIPEDIVHRVDIKLQSILAT